MLKDVYAQDIIEAVNKPGFRVKVTKVNSTEIDGELEGLHAKIAIKSDDFDLWTVAERGELYKPPKAEPEKTPEQLEEENRLQVSKHNCQLLEQYIDSMKDDLEATICEATKGTIEIKFGNPCGFQPYCSSCDHHYKDDRIIYLPSIYIKLSKKLSYEDAEELNCKVESSLDFCEDTLTYLPNFCISELGFDYASTGVTEADDFHSGKRNVDAWNKYIINGESEFEDLNDVHDVLDSDAELFACVKWKYLDGLGTLLAIGCIESAETLKEAAESFFESNYRKEVHIPDIDSGLWIFEDQVAVYLGYEAADKLEKEVKGDTNGN